MQQKITTLPVIPEDQNGSGIPATRREYYDEYGNLTWKMDERGFLTRMAYDIPTGALTQRIDDVDTAQVSDSPSGWTTPADGGRHVITDFTHDSQGRNIKTLRPEHEIDIGGTATMIRQVSWTVYKDDIFQTWKAQGYTTVSGSSSRDRKSVV